MKADPDGIAPPETRLPPAMVGGISIVVGLFWFAVSSDDALAYGAQ